MRGEVKDGRWKMEDGRKGGMGKGVNPKENRTLIAVTTVHDPV